MSSQPAPAFTSINFSRQFDFRTGALGIEVRPSANSQIYKLIANNTPFAGPGDVSVGDVSINASGGDLTFTTPSGICDDIAGSSQGGYPKLIEELSRERGFLSSPAGQWLEALAFGNLLAPVWDSEAFKRTADAAEKAGKLLKAGSSENEVMKALHAWIDPRIHLPEITKQLETCLSDDWIRARLTALFNRSVLGGEEVRQIQTLIGQLENKAEAFYRRAVKALNDTYNFSFSAALLRIIVLKQNSGFAPADFLEGKSPVDDILLQQSIVSV